MLRITERGTGEELLVPEHRVESISGSVSGGSLVTLVDPDRMVVAVESISYLQAQMKKGCRPRKPSIWQKIAWYAVNG